MILNKLIIVFFLLPGFAGFPALVTGETPRLVTGDYLDSPVYYEIQPPPPFLADNRELLHQNRLKLRYFPAVDVTGWDWVSGGLKDFSWWIQLEELRFLLPLIHSQQSADRELAREWFRSWYESNKTGALEHRARWKYPMSAAYRAMVLVFMLKTEQAGDGTDKELVAMLREVLLQHQEYLADAKNFESDNNHGMLESFALLELCRVFPNEDYENTGLNRMVQITRVSVSDLGLHKEHSPAYQFVFLDWLVNFSSYLSRIPRFDRAQTVLLGEYADQLQNTSWYLHDLDGTVPEIGDTDSMNVFARYPLYKTVGGDTIAPVFYDPEAGFAIYKDPRRYAVFSMQTGRPLLLNHYHDDVLSVYYRFENETILGDPGKYSHTWSSLRRYFRSMPAHNCVFPVEYVERGWSYFSLAMAGSTSVATGVDTTRFSATVDHAVFSVRRTVIVPHRESGIEFVDEIRPAVESARQAESVVWTWNFGYDVRSVTPVADTGGTSLAFDIITRKGRRLRFRVEIDGSNTGIRYEIVRGREKPRGGWYSPQLFVLSPSYTVVLEVPMTGDFTTRTWLESTEDG